MALLCMILFIGFAVGVADAAAKSCAGPNNVPYDNYCYSETDSDGHSAPNCVNSGTLAAPVWTCGRCAVNCDCGVGEYCVKTPGPSAGSCKTVASTEKIGAACTSFALAGTPGARNPKEGVDDASLCGGAIFSDADGTFITYEWIGSCASGKCVECAGDPAAWAIATTAQIVPGLTTAIVPAVNTTAISVAMATILRDTGSMICSDRYCESGVFVQVRFLCLRQNQSFLLTTAKDTSWFWELYPTGVMSGILVFVIFIFLLMLGAVAIQCCTNFRRRSSRGGATKLPTDNSAFELEIPDDDAGTPKRN